MLAVKPLQSVFRIASLALYGLFFLTVAIVNEVIWRTQTDDFWVAFRGGLWMASAAFGIWQVFFIMKHLVKDEDEVPPVEGPAT